MWVTCQAILGDPSVVAYSYPALLLKGSAFQKADKRVPVWRLKYAINSSRMGEIKIKIIIGVIKAEQSLECKSINFTNTIIAAWYDCL